jgi:hypothetical protein
MKGRTTAPDSYPANILLTTLTPVDVSHYVVYLTVWYTSSRASSPCGFTSWPERHPLTVLNSIQADLLKNPARGDLVQGLGGIRKARCSNPARGKDKRGGYRYLFPVPAESRTHSPVVPAGQGRTGRFVE